MWDLPDPFQSHTRRAGPTLLQYWQQLPEIHLISFVMGDVVQSGQTKPALHTWQSHTAAGGHFLHLPMGESLVLWLRDTLVGTNCLAGDTEQQPDGKNKEARQSLSNGISPNNFCISSLSFLYVLIWNYNERCMTYFFFFFSRWTSKEHSEAGLSLSYIDLYAYTYSLVSFSDVMSIIAATWKP